LIRTRLIGLNPIYQTVNNMLTLQRPVFYNNSNHGRSTTGFYPWASIVSRFYQRTMKLSKRIGILKSIKSYLPRNERILFYNAMIKPLFLYCSITWTNCSKNNITKIFKLQKRCARIILDAEPRHSSINIFNNLGWLPFYVESDIRKCIKL
jgi:hypothetical protein